MNKTAQHAPAVQSRFLVLLMICVAVLLVIRLGVQSILPLNHDMAANLYRAVELLHGARLYVDIYAVHPPQIIWFCLPPAALHVWFGAPLKVAYLGYFLLVAAFAIWMSRKPLRRMTAEAGGPLHALALLALACFALAFPAYSYTQKDHLVFVLLLPYLLRSVSDEDSSGAHALSSGLLAGLALAIKPFTASPGRRWNFCGFGARGT